MPRKSGEPLDAFLGRVEQHGVDIQARTRNIIDVPTSTPRDLHHSIVKLFRDVESFCLVTTNFDRHFTTAAKAKHPAIDILIGPALPLGREFTGVVYLHGAVGGTQRYSLTLPGQNDFWTNLGIVPVHFPPREGTDRYGAIDAALANWSKRAGMGTFDHKARITQLAEAGPPVDPESVDYLRAVLSESVTLKFFTETATRIEWLRWVEDEGLFAPLLGTAAITADEPRLFAYWFADRYAIEHPREALEFVQRHAANLNPELTRAIAFRLASRNETVAEDTLRLWAAALLALRTTTADSLTRLLTRCAEAEVIDAAALLFRFLLRPQLKFERPWPHPDFGGPLTLSAEMAIGGEAYHLRRAWDDVLKGHIEMLHREFLAMVEEYLNNAWAALKVSGQVADDWDPMSFGRSASLPGPGRQRYLYISSFWPAVGSASYVTRS